MKKYLNDAIIIGILVAAVLIGYFYVPRSVVDLHRQINLSKPQTLDGKRMELGEKVEKYLANSLPKDPGKTPTILHLFVGNQRKLLDLRFNQAIAEIKDTKVGPGKARIWSLMNMGVVAKISNKTIAFDVADMPLSWVQKKLADTVDMVLVTHGDSDHYDSGLLKKVLTQGKKVVLPEAFGFLDDSANVAGVVKLKDGETVDIDGVKITAFQTDHRGDGDFSEPGAWYLVETDGLKLLHTGDGRDFKDKNKKANLKNLKVDVFLANVQTHPYNIRDINPKVVVPLHLYKFVHSREELAKSTFDFVTKLYGQYEKDLKGIGVQLLFPGESFEYSR